MKRSKLELKNVEVNIEMYTDIASPWCYLAFNRLQRSLKMASEFGIVAKVQYKPTI